MAIDAPEDVVEIDALVQKLVKCLEQQSRASQIDAAKELLNRLQSPDWVDSAPSHDWIPETFCLDYSPVVVGEEREALKTILQSGSWFLQSNGKKSSDSLRKDCQFYLELRREVFDGPIDGNRFRHKGQVHGMKPKEWALVNFLWTSKNRLADWRELAMPVWNDSEKIVTDGRMRGVYGRANEFFDEKGLPYRISLDRRGNKVHLKILLQNF